MRSLRPGEYRRVLALGGDDAALAELPAPLRYTWRPPLAGLPGDVLALELAGELVGYAGYAVAEGAPERWSFTLLVLPAFRRRGIGGHALGALGEELRPRGGARLFTLVYANQSENMRFLLQRGFHAIGRSISCQLDLAAAPTSLDDPEAIVAGQGLRLTPLDRLPRHSLAERLLPLWNSTRPDQPQAWPFVPYSARRLAQEMLEPDAVALPFSYAVLTPQNEAVALALSANVGAGQLGTTYLAVDPGMRRRGLALALKLRLIADARAAHYVALFAENETHNAAMRALNRRLGYRDLLELVVVEREL
jgi:GNAT superfamily N-acetyltransferase